MGRNFVETSPSSDSTSEGTNTCDVSYQTIPASSQGPCRSVYSR